MNVKVGILVSYDYYMLKHSLPLIYEDADGILLALDENNTTWGGEKITIDPEFFKWIEEFDTQKKITLYYDNFYVPSITRMQMETRERNMMVEKMGEGWNIQLDADEYFINFKGFVKYLKTNKFIQKKNTQICPYWISLYKEMEDGILYVKDPEPFYCGSNNPHYTNGRNSKGQIKVYAPFVVLHQSWARNEQELAQKLNNFGHSIEFDIEAYMKLYRSFDKTNYHTALYVHPIHKKAWKELDFCPGNTIEEVIENLNKDLPKIDGFKRFKKSLGQRIKHGRLF